MLSRGLTLTDPHLDSGITGVGIRQKKKKKVQQAIDEDATITEEIEIEMEKVMKDRRKRKIVDYLISAGFYADDGLNVMKFLTGTKDLSGQGIIHGLEAVGHVLGETANKEIMKVVAHTGGHVLSGVLHGVIGGAVMLLDMYQVFTSLLDHFQFLCISSSLLWNTFLLTTL